MSFQGRFKTKGLDSIRLEGEVVGSIKIHAYGANGMALLASGTTVPTDTTAGFAKGCLFIDTDVAAGSSAIYENVGTTASCNFDLTGSAIDELNKDVTVLTDKKIQFRDTGLYLQSSVDGQLDIDADTKLQVTAPTVDIESSADIILDGDVTIDGTHTFDTGTGAVGIGGDVLVATTKKVQFRDTGLYLQSSIDGQMDIIGDTKIQVTAPTVDIESSSDIVLDGDVTIDGIHTFDTGTGAVGIKGDATVDTDKKMQFRDAGLYVQSTIDGQLDVIGDVKIQVTAPTVDIEASADIVLDGDVTIDGAHTFDTGTGNVGVGGDVLVATDKKLQLRDTGLYLQSSVDGQMDLIGDTKIQVTAPTVDIESSSDIALDGDVTIDGAHTLTTGTGVVTLKGVTTIEAKIKTDEVIGDALALPYVGIVKTLKYTLGWASHATADYTVAADANKTQQNFQLGAGNIIPSLGRVIDVIAVATEGWVGAAGAEAGLGTEIGTDSSGAQYMVSANVDTADDIASGAAAAACAVQAAFAATSVWVGLTPTTNNWNQLTAGETTIYVTYIDVSESA